MSMQIQMQMQMYMFMYMNMYTCVCVCVLYIYICISTHTHTHTHTHCGVYCDGLFLTQSLHTQAHTHTHTQRTQHGSALALGLRGRVQSAHPCLGDSVIRRIGHGSAVLQDVRAHVCGFTRRACPRMRKMQTAATAERITSC